MALDQLTEWDSHGLFDGGGAVDMAGDAEQLGADIVGPADGGEPRRAAAENIGRGRDRFDIVDRRRAAVETDIGGKQPLLPPLAPLAFHTFPKSALFTPDIIARAVGRLQVLTAAP